MSQPVLSPGKKSSFLSTIKQALKGGEQDFTTGSIRKSVILLAIPMMLEMVMESVFALVDLYFVGHLHNSSYAVQTVGLTESILTVIYSLAIGISMAATAVVARRIGERDSAAAAKAGMQAVLIACALTIGLSLLGFSFATQILQFMGASAQAARYGTPFMQIMMGSSLFIMLLFLLNGIFRGAGNAAIAMKSLWVANVANIILCPIFINGWGPVPAFGLTGAAIATTVGRGLGVAYQVYHLLGAKQLERAEQSVLKTAKYNVLFMALVTIISLAGAQYFVAFFTNDVHVQEVAVRAIRYMSTGYVFYGIGMVLINTFNGAGDTWTPTWVNLFGFWLFQIPLAYVLAKSLQLGPEGVFLAIPISETVITLISIVLFRRGKWKTVQV